MPLSINKSTIFTNIQKLEKSKYFELLPDFKEERTQKFTTLVLTIVALSFFALFAINPTLSTIAKLQKELSDSQQVDQQLQTKINNLSILQDKYVALQNDLPAVLDTLPKNSEIPLLTGQVQALLKNNNMSVNNFQTFEVEITPSKTLKRKFTSFSFSFSADGGFDNISKLISSLTKMQRITSLDVISITRKGGDNQLLQLSLKGTAYFKE